MVGTTGLRNLRIDCIIGVYEHERIEVQPVFVDVEVDYDFAAAAMSDSIDHAVDYGGIASMAADLARDRRFQLLETMAEELATLLLERLPMIERVRLEIRKPEAVPAASNSFVRLERGRS